VDGKDDSALSLLNKLGKELVYYRSWGNQGSVLDRASEQNFKHDHDLSKGQRVPIEYPQRVAFGLPHNYGKGEAKCVRPDIKDVDRRASPLFLHIHQVDEEPPVGLVAFLPAVFLPEPRRMKVFGASRQLDEKAEESEAFWSAVTGYLHRLKGVGTPRQTDLPNATEVTLG